MSDSPPPTTVYVAWTSDRFDDDLVGESTGPWRELRRVADAVVLVESTESLSRVYHELKWTLPHSASLLVTPAGSTPKARGLPAGTVSWLRSRTGT